MQEKYNYSIYTPQKFAEEMAKKALDNYFKRGKTKENLEKIRIGDLSCGNGNLLLEILEQLLKISKELTGEYIFLKEWITGFDINIDAVKLAKIKGKELLKKYNIDSELNILCKNSLQNENMRFNIILGNPPYLGEKNNKSLFQEIRKTKFGKKYYEAKMDYLYFFIEKGIELLEENGTLVYLTTNYWLRADSGTILRKTLQENGNFLFIQNYDNSLFCKATGQHNIIFLWEKKILENIDVEIQLPEKNFYTNNKDLYDKSGKIILADKIELEFTKKILKNANFLLKDITNINQGIVTGYDKAFIFDEYREEFKNYLKPFYKNKDIGKYKIDKNQFWVLYLDRYSKPDEVVLKHLEKYREKLSKRREAVNNMIKWWQLQWSREREIFSMPKIIARQRCKTNQFAYDEKEFFGSADIYFITKKDEDISLFYILGYMNSEVFLQWYKYNGKMKGKNFEFYSTPLKATPIYYSKDKKEIEYIENMVKEQLNNFSEEREELINKFFKEKLLNYKNS